MFEHILLPTDGSALSQKAEAVALDLARALAARVTVLHVTPPFSPDAMSAHAAMRALDRHAAEVRAQAFQATEGSVHAAHRRGIECDRLHLAGAEPWRTIVDVATERRCDLIVMASHGHRGVDALLLGSETTKVLTHSRVPVLVCR
jgi:nucleotide-binding universal stress UspA family protein